MQPPLFLLVAFLFILPTFFVTDTTTHNIDSVGQIHRSNEYCIIPGSLFNNTQSVVTNAFVN